MSTNANPMRIGFFGSDGCEGDERHGCGLWPAGYAASITAVGATPVILDQFGSRRAGLEMLEDVHAVVFAEHDTSGERRITAGEKLCEWCRKRRLPLLVIDRAMQLLNSIHGGSSYADLAHELPEALQHRHPPERGLRHAINVEPKTRLAKIYGDGEVVVNSEHRRAICRVARGFRVTGRALDGVIEAIEPETDAWYALGVQWHPASATSSGLDIQLFRGLVEAAKERSEAPARPARIHAA